MFRTKERARWGKGYGVEAVAAASDRATLSNRLSSRRAFSVGEKPMKIVRIVAAAEVRGEYCASVATRSHEEAYLKTGKEKATRKAEVRVKSRQRNGGYENRSYSSQREKRREKKRITVKFRSSEVLTRGYSTSFYFALYI